MASKDKGGKGTKTSPSKTLKEKRADKKDKKRRSREHRVVSPWRPARRRAPCSITARENKSAVECRRLGRHVDNSARTAPD